MKAIIQDTYGSAEVFQLADIDKPEPGKKEVLVRVHAAAVHIGDVMMMKGMPYVMRLGTGFTGPRKKVPGFDFAGSVEAVGEDVSGFKPGDEVFGECNGSCAEYSSVGADRIAAKPSGLTFEQAAAVPVSGVTALRGIRDAGKVQSGETVLINGATGGVGIYAIQIAKSLDAIVTGVCSGTNEGLARSLGADHVVDYTIEDYTEGDERYDVILDNVANHSLADSRRALTAKGRLVPNSARSQGRVFGAVGRMAQAAIVAMFVRQQARPFYSPVKTQDLLDLTQLIDTGQLIPVIDRTYPLSETAAAMEYVSQGHASGKTVITI